MAWEDRNGRQYYYRKRREGKRVISEYVGPGLIGALCENLDTLDWADRAKAREAMREQKANAARIDGKISEIEKFTKTMTQAVLLVSGYHAPKRQWRKIKDV